MNKYHSPQNTDPKQLDTPQIENQPNIENAEIAPRMKNPPDSNNKKIQKPYYTQWWFWLIIIWCFFSLLTAITDKDEEVNDDQNTNIGTETAETTPEHIGSQNNPYVLEASVWYTSHCDGSSSQKYIDQWVMVSGTILSISDYGNLKGYYLSGGSGSGLVCWVDEETTSAQYGQRLTYLGKVTVEDSKQIELSSGAIQNASWPTEKQQSPITISEWTWVRDSFGGVEWNFRFTNNTDKTVKYIAMEWYCYNAVGDLVYDEISRKNTCGIKYTGPLEPRKTSDLMCNSTLFYSYSYHTSELMRLTVEFTDGTIIHINDKAYTDIIR